MKPQCGKLGRPRRYDFLSGASEKPLTTDVEQFLAALDELQERVLDQIADLSQDALDFVPEGTTNSVAMLVIHMAGAEAGWISRVTQTPMPPDLALRLQPGAQAASGDLLPSPQTVSGLTALCREVRDRFTRPALSGLSDTDTQICVQQKHITVRGVLMHLIWHWTYHSGQIGLLRRLWGARYRWTFAENVGTAGTDPGT